MATLSEHEGRMKLTYTDNEGNTYEARSGLEGDNSVSWLVTKHLDGGEEAEGIARTDLLEEYGGDVEAITEDIQESYRRVEALEEL